MSNHTRETISFFGTDFMDLAEEAIVMARVTGSIGATARRDNGPITGITWPGKTDADRDELHATVRRIGQSNFWRVIEYGGWSYNVHDNIVLAHI